MDFKLESPNQVFSLVAYFPYVEQELKAYGFEVAIQQKALVGPKHIDRAFLKMNTRVSMLHKGVPQAVVDWIAREQLLKIKIEVDDDPPAGAKESSKERNYEYYFY
ncbi:MAG: hypothetical protein GF344_14245, partial [Chitinivibrionales bacterium]|nr:hypothetical protein [Chitinivibrionales bacterium]MBD3357888.1 hypothetical protein [Chitinivibrionales bacterium]